MDEKKRVEGELRSSRPASWEQIPDIDLYKDQLTEYLKRQHIGFVLGMEEPLTSAMINNYIKVGVLPRAKGKRYDRDHIAYLTAVALLKQVLSVQETGDLLGIALADHDESAEEGDAEDRGEGADDEAVKKFYGEFTKDLDAALCEEADKLTKVKSMDDLSDLAMKLAVRSYADKLLCRELLQLTKGQNPEF